MKLKHIEVLSSHEIQQIHIATMELLGTVGIKIDDRDVQALFQKNGAELDKNSGFIRIPESMVKEQLKYVPKFFKLQFISSIFSIKSHSHTQTSISSFVRNLSK